MSSANVKGSYEGDGPDHSCPRGGLLKQKLKLDSYRSGGNGKWRYTIQPIPGQLSFDKGFYVFIRALQLLVAHNEGVIMVGLAGPSGSGKSAFSRKVQDVMKGVTVLSMDMYNDGSKVVDSNFDDPRLTDYDLLLANIRQLRAGEAAAVPIYDFKQSRRTGFTQVPVPESRVIIIEGIYALSERLADMMDLRVCVTGGVHFDLVKRVLRDIDRSGQDPDEIIQQVSDTVYPMYKAFIEPTLRTAHISIYNTFNPFSGLLNASFSLKSAVELTQEQVMSQLGWAEADATSASTQSHDIYLLPPHEDPESCQSWLRMRNKDGRYSLMFEEWVTDGDFIISPRITFEVSVRVLGGLMALGYHIGAILQRTSRLITHADFSIKLDAIDGLGSFVQISGTDRRAVQELGEALGLAGTYIPRSYIEQVQLSHLTQQFQNVSEDMLNRFQLESPCQTEGEPGSGGEVMAGDVLQSTSAPPESFMSGAKGRLRRSTADWSHRPGMGHLPGGGAAPRGIPSGRRRSSEGRPPSRVEGFRVTAGEGVPDVREAPPLGPRCGSLSLSAGSSGASGEEEAGRAAADWDRNGRQLAPTPASRDELEACVQDLSQEVRCLVGSQAQLLSTVSAVSSALQTLLKQHDAREAAATERQQELVRALSAASSPSLAWMWAIVGATAGVCAAVLLRRP